MPGVSRFECSIVFSTLSCVVSSRCWYMLPLWTKQSDHEYRRETWPASSYVSADPPLHLFLFPTSTTIPCKILTVPVVSQSYLQYQWPGELFLGQVVSAGPLPQQQMVGIKRLWLLVASAKLRSSSSVVCRLKWNLLKCIIHWFPGKQNRWRDCGVALKHLIVFGENHCVCSNP